MKKYIFSILIIVLVLGLMFDVMYAIDISRMNNNKPVVFSTWGYDYTTPDNDENIVIDESQNKDKNFSGNDFKVSGDVESFIGTVIEETTRYMIVEPNSGEMERKSSDKIMINYGVDHIDYLYGIGRKVVIRYTGGIMETYPAQINTDDILAEGYEDFELSVTKDDKVEKRRILSNKDLYKYNSDYNLYYYGLKEVNVKVDNKEMSLEDALKEGYITIDGIIAKANRDIKNVEEKYANLEEHQSSIKLFPTEISYRDGGSIEFNYGDYKIIKFHTLDGNRDVYIGSLDMTLDKVNS